MICKFLQESASFPALKERAPMAYRLIACDFDDTLFPTSRRITLRTKQAVSTCSAYGARFILATGRTLASILPYYRELGLKTPVITSGGAEVYDQDFKLIYSAPLPSETTHRLLNRAHGLGLHVHIYQGSNFCYAKESVHSRYYSERTGLVGKEMPEIYDRTDLVTPKLLIVAEPEKIVENMARFQEEFPELNIVRSMGSYLEFAHADANKGSALRFTAEYLGYSMDETIAIGDAEIDLTMLNAAHLGICPANGMPRAKAAADLICASCDEDCVAQILEEYVFHV